MSGCQDLHLGFKTGYWTWSTGGGELNGLSMIIFDSEDGPLPLFEVDNVHSARREFEAAGVEVMGSIERDSLWEWIHVRAPDGNLYEFASRLSEA